MSFHWDMSSDEELEVKEDCFGRATGFKQNIPMHDAEKQFSSAGLPFIYISKDCEDEEVDEVDWEDADDDLSEPGDVKPAAKNNIDQLQPVTIDLDAAAVVTDMENKKRKLPKRRKRYRFLSLPSDMQSFLQNLHRAHFLALASHAFFLSKLCSDWELLHIAHSLLPIAWWDTSTETASYPSRSIATNAPTKSDILELRCWFFDLVNHTEERRRERRMANLAAGAPRLESHREKTYMRKGRKSQQPLQVKSNFHPSVEMGCDGRVLIVSLLSYGFETYYGAKNLEENHLPYTSHRLIRYCTYLSGMYDEDPQLYDDDSKTLWTSVDKALLLVSVCRSMGWRARFVILADPIKCDLDEDHPILNHSNFNFFRSYLGKDRGGGKARDRPGDKKPPAKRPKVSSDTEGELAEGTEGFHPILGWVEILCQSDTKSPLHPLRWIHVDPAREIVDQPEQVEFIFVSRREGGGRPTKKRAVIQYAVAAEHRCVALRESSVDLHENLLLGQLVDVTPRYSYSWTESLRARVAQVMLNFVPSTPFDAWLTNTLSSMNHSFRQRAKETYSQLVGFGSSTIDTDNTTSKVMTSHATAPSWHHANGAGYVDDHDEDETCEREELQKSARQEPIPTNKVAFKTHPMYVIPSVLTSTQVLAPDAKSRICGSFKGELVYRRSDVSTALSAKKWLYQRRKVIDSELSTPVLYVKPRRKATPKGFQALKSYGVGTANDGSEEARARDLLAASKPLEEANMEALYAIWQTVPWSPDPVGPNDKIPVNEYNNMELELMNPGLVHVDEPRMAQVAKKLGIPYAPCLLGFEGQGGNRVPVIRGVIVHEHNEQVLREAHHEVSSYVLEQENKKRSEAVYSRWRHLIVGVLTKQRLEQDYKDDDHEEQSD